MIFVTIGTQEPFDRLIKFADTILPNLTNTEIVAQVFQTQYKVKNITAKTFLSPNEFDLLFKKADLIISHAGMGSIISALTLGKPIIVIPRIASLGEHRNDHQLATAKEFEKLGYIHVAYDEQQLQNKLVELFSRSSMEPLHRLGEWASNDLINSLKEFLK